MPTASANYFVCDKETIFEDPLILKNQVSIMLELSMAVQFDLETCKVEVEVVLWLSWGCDNFKAKNIFILSQTEPWKILVRVAIPTRTACARGYSHAHNTLILVYISVRVAIATRTCAWLSHAHVYSIQIR